MKFISVDEYLMGRATLSELSPEIIGNINILIPKVNDLLEIFSEYRSVNSGLRLDSDHVRIYDEINTKRRKKGLAPVSIPWGSTHLSGEGIDLEDKNDKLKEFCIKNIHLLKKLGLYMESPEFTDTWCHLQCRKTKSGLIIFKPY